VNKEDLDEDALEWLEVVEEGCFMKDQEEHLRSLMFNYGTVSDEEADYIIKVLRDL